MMLVQRAKSRLKHLLVYVLLWSKVKKVKLSSKWINLIMLGGVTVKKVKLKDECYTDGGIHRQSIYLVRREVE